MLMNNSFSRLALWMAGWGVILFTNYTFLGLWFLLGYGTLMYFKYQEIKDAIKKRKD